MTQREVLNRLQDDCENTQIHGCECFATKLLDLAAEYYKEQKIKNECFTFLIANNLYTAFHQSNQAELMETIAESTTK
ncbi:MAG: hypothetical protein SNG38_09050 [Rikenellaceae bacterium]